MAPLVVELFTEPPHAASLPEDALSTRGPTLAFSTRPRGRPTGRAEPTAASHASGPDIATRPGDAPHHLTMRTGPQVPSTAEQLSAAASDHPQPGELPDLPGERARFALEVARGNHDWAAAVALTDELRAQELVEQKDGTYRTDATTFTAKIAKDGTVAFDDKPNLQIHGLSGTFDATDAILRAHGQDPYASAKRAFLDRTRDQRFELGKVDRREQLGRSAELMRANLERVWTITRDPAQRKQLAFELWDDCAETGDDRLVEGGAAARAFLVRFVQVKLAQRYTEAELAQLNAHRHSRATFDPYGS